MIEVPMALPIQASEGFDPFPMEARDDDAAMALP